MPELHCGEGVSVGHMAGIVDSRNWKSILFLDRISKYRSKRGRQQRYQAEKGMSEHLQFAARCEFRNWLKDNCLSSGGVWLLFGKTDGPQTLTAAEALEEALCFGWIDGQVRSIDAKSYLKYFSVRRKNSNWSEKNKALVAILEKQGLMTAYGEAKIAEAKQGGQWQAPKPPAVTDGQTAVLSDLLSTHEPAYTNFLAMSPSVKRTYTRAYFDAKTDDGRSRRLLWMVERLNKNLKPM